MSTGKKRGKQKKGRKLWRQISARLPQGVSRSVFWGTLRRSINEGTYEIPEEWDVTIKWRNRKDAEMRSADFTEAMQESAESSRGWDGAILAYINQEIGKLDKPKAIAARVAADTKARTFARRSAAARKGWRTRKADFRRRSAAARKGWRTRRART